MSRLSYYYVVLISCASLIVLGQEPPERPPNVILLIADDLRPDLGCYGHRDMHTPNIDRLASHGLLFKSAYCQVALCNPSRTSLLTGLRPDTTQVYGNGGHFRDQRPQAVTLPQYFKQHGYHTQSLGKIFHPGFEDAPSWSVPPWEPSNGPYGPVGRRQLERRVARIKAAEKKPPKHILGPPWEAADVSDEELTDGETAAKAIDVLRETKDRPFLLALGFLRPHLPLAAPRKYWNLYPVEKIKTAANPQPPQDVPACALHDWSELRRYEGMPHSGPLSEEQAREVIRAYRASTSYLDAQVGSVLDEVQRLDLAKNTIVVLLGDHGWQLGEHGQWCKHTNFEVATRAPLIIAAPGHRTAGQVASGLVEFIDLYPTLVELCRLPPPEGLDGMSLAPLLQNPEALGKQAAFSQFQRKVEGIGMVMGRSVRTTRYRFTQWTSTDRTYVKRELYDHQVDPNENINLADHLSQVDTVRELVGLLPP